FQGLPQLPSVICDPPLISCSFGISGGQRSCQRKNSPVGQERSTLLNIHEPRVSAHHHIIRIRVRTTRWSRTHPDEGRGILPLDRLGADAQHPSPPPTVPARRGGGREGQAGAHAP